MDRTVRGRDHLIVFVRAPRFGAVKRRLASQIGPGAAWRFYRELSRAVARTLARDRRWRVTLAVTPDRFADRARFWPADIRRRKQGGGDLGRRMHRALAAPRGARVVIVGSDIPGIASRDIAAAFRALGAADAVFGPAADGGYWLIGARAATPPYRAFRGVRWSSRHALADTVANLDPRRRVAWLAEREDVDDGGSYRRWLASTGRDKMAVSHGGAG